jgi:hypothetical protein
MRRIMRKIVDGQGDQLGDLSTVAEPGVVDIIKKKVAGSNWYQSWISSWHVDWTEGEGGTWNTAKRDQLECYMYQIR